MFLFNSQPCPSRLFGRRNVQRHMHHGKHGVIAHCSNEIDDTRVAEALSGGIERGIGELVAARQFAREVDGDHLVFSCAGDRGAIEDRLDNRFIDTELEHGAMGENLTLSGLLETDVWVGDVLRFAHCVLRVSQPREPCFKFNAAMGFNGAVKLMAQQGNCGFYLSVDEPGTVQAGEAFELVPGPRRLSIPSRFQAKMFKHMR